MKGKRLSVALATVLALSAIAAGTAAATGSFWSHRTDTERAVSSALKNKHPKNVIFLLGDGMGTQEITAARYPPGPPGRPGRKRSTSGSPRAPARASKSRAKT
jgi:alkaline phosphatase/streptomycin-6-phosphatase